MAELAAALAQLLHFFAARLPAAFLGAGCAAGVNLARLAETAAFVVMQARRLSSNTLWPICAGVNVHTCVPSRVSAEGPSLYGRVHRRNWRSPAQSSHGHCQTLNVKP